MFPTRIAKPWPRCRSRWTPLNLRVARPSSDPVHVFMVYTEAIKKVLYTYFGVYVCTIMILGSFERHMPTTRALD